MLTDVYTDVRGCYLVGVNREVLSSSLSIIRIYSPDFQASRRSRKIDPLSGTSTVSALLHMDILCMEALTSA